MKPVFHIVSVIAVLLLLPVSGVFALDVQTLRQQMLREIERDAAYTASYTGRGQFSAPVMAAMAAVPRHLFVPASERRSAYDNRPLPIGYGQTISQPYIVALMTELLAVSPTAKILEIGTGSGYQAAILGQLVTRVYTLEIIEPLAQSATDRLAELGYKNISVKTGDGYYGWPEHGPFDGIIVTAAASHIPPPLIKQLKPGGRMVIPVGGRFLTQYLTLVEKKMDASVSTRQLLPVAFVPLTGKH